VVRATLATWYQDLVTELPVIRHGMLQAPTAPGLGTVLRRSEAMVVRSAR
jgi:L-alanine-DL-glutamate epimerase-like enolase superfamily enzyme